MKDALATQQGFVTGSVQVDAHYSEQVLSLINRPYGISTSLKLYVDPVSGTTTVYDTRGGGVPLGIPNEVGIAGYNAWGLNTVEVLRRLKYLRPEDASAHSGFQLTYTSYGRYEVDTYDRGGDEHVIDTFFYFGIPTAVPDLPRSGHASYNGVAEGKYYDFDGEYTLNGTATLQADFASGNIETTMLLRALAPGVDMDLGTFDGVASLVSGQNAFRGTWLASSNGFEGSILGSFFGPAASEFGYTFGIIKSDFSAFGGGVVVGGQNTGVPLPPPPPPPLPPPPAPPGATFPLGDEATFGTIASSMSYSGSVAGGAVTVGPTTTSPYSNSRTITVTPDYANGTYTVRENGASSSFQLPELFAQPDPGVRLVSLSDDGSDRLVMFNNLAAGSGTNDPFLQLHYLSFAFLYENGLPNSEHRTTALLFGNPTPMANMPISGTAKYVMQGFAAAFTGYGGYADVQGELTADFGAGTVENSFAIYNYNGASVAPFYRVSGTGSIASASATFSGPLSGTNHTLTGSYAGAFFGPNAEEAGFTFSLSGSLPHPISGEPGWQQQTIVGAAGGKR